MKNFKFLLLISMCLLSFLLGSCASVGKKYNFSNISQLRLKETKVSDYQELFGKPITQETKVFGSDSYESAMYVYSSADIGKARARSLTVEFKNGLLNAYRFTSSFDTDQTVVDLEKFDQIKFIEGETTVESILSLLGQPHGKALCPSKIPMFESHCDGGAEVWVWNALEKFTTLGKSGAPRTWKIFAILDKDGVLKRIDKETTSQPRRM